MEKKSEKRIEKLSAAFSSNYLKVHNDTIK